MRSKFVLSLHQILTMFSSSLKDPFLVLTGPSRAIALIDHPKFEVELYAIGRMPSEDKVLSALYFEYNNIGNGRFAGLIQTRRDKTKQRSTIELKFAHLAVPLEATIEVYHCGGTSNFHGCFFCSNGLYG